MKIGVEYASLALASWTPMHVAIVSLQLTLCSITIQAFHRRFMAVEILPHAHAWVKGKHAAALDRKPLTIDSH